MSIYLKLLKLILCLSLMSSCSVYRIETPQGKSKIYTTKDTSESRLSSEQRKQIHTFNLENINKQSQGLKRCFETINGNQLNHIIDSFDKTLVTFWHRCPSNYESLRFSKHIADSLNANLIIVSSDYELNMLNQHLNSINYNKTVYIAKNPSKPTFKLAKKLELTKAIAPEIYATLKDLSFNLTFFYFDKTNPKNNFSSTPLRFQNAEEDYKKITRENAINVYYSPIFQ